jgi:hypothetical protein
MRIGESAGLPGFTASALLALAASGCVDYNATTQATRSIYSVRVVTSAAEVADCRLIGRVNARDEARGCGLTVQPTTEECLRYQVRRAGGDTLVSNGFVGDAYDCSGGGASASAPAAPPATAAPASAPSAPAPAPTLAAALPAPTPAPAPTAAPAPAPAPTDKRARVVRERGAARGCVYVGDLDPKTACPGATGASSAVAEDCLARRGAEAGADTVVFDSVSGSAQLFACKATP